MGPYLYCETSFNRVRSARHSLLGNFTLSLCKINHISTVNSMGDELIALKMDGLINWIQSVPTIPTINFSETLMGLTKAESQKIQIMDELVRQTRK